MDHLAGDRPIVLMDCATGSLHYSVCCAARVLRYVEGITKSAELQELLRCRRLLRYVGVLQNLLSYKGCCVAGGYCVTGELRFKICTILEFTPFQERFA